MEVARTERLSLRWLTPDDAPFILALVNDPSWLRFIGDRGVRDLASARDYLAKGPLNLYAQHGFGLYLVERRADGAPLGMCGLVKRPALADVDLGFAFMPAFRGQGYAREAAEATLRHAREDVGLSRLVAITVAENVDSIGLLTRLDFAYERTVEITEGDPVRLYARTL